MSNKEKQRQQLYSTTIINKQVLSCKWASPFINRFILRPNLFVRDIGETYDKSFSYEDIKMRRKTHILQHHSHKVHHTPNLTKKQKYVMAVRGIGRNTKTYATQNKQYTNPNIINPSLTNPNRLPLNIAYNNNNQIGIINDNSSACLYNETTLDRSNIPPTNGGSKLDTLKLNPNVPIYNYSNSNNSSSYTSSNVVSTLMYTLKDDVGNKINPTGVKTPGVNINPNMMPAVKLPETFNIIEQEFASFEGNSNNVVQGIQCLSCPGTTDSNNGQSWIGNCPPPNGECLN